MGSYGIGVSRAVAAIAEATCDEIGLRWPHAIAPFNVHIVMAGKEDDLITTTANNLAQVLDSSGIRVLLDDRIGVSPGVKFKDAELIGNPIIVVVGRGAANGVVEVRNRLAGTASEIAIADAAEYVRNACASV
jgi:prolyl-tRNA synthetase